MALWNCSVFKSTFFCAAWVRGLNSWACESHSRPAAVSRVITSPPPLLNSLDSVFSDNSGGGSVEDLLEPLQLEPVHPAGETQTLVTLQRNTLNSLSHDRYQRAATSCCTSRIRGNANRCMSRLSVEETVVQDELVHLSLMMLDCFSSWEYRQTVSY